MRLAKPASVKFVKPRLSAWREGQANTALTKSASVKFLHPAKLRFWREVRAAK